MSEQEKNAILNDHEMSEKEMEAASGGGVKISYDAQCISTVEDGSSCYGSDACWTLYNHYHRDKRIHGCCATVEGMWCSSNDYCTAVQIRYAECKRDFAMLDKTDV